MQGRHHARCMRHGWRHAPLGRRARRHRAHGAASRATGVRARSARAARHLLPCERESTHLLPCERESIRAPGTACAPKGAAAHANTPIGTEPRLCEAHASKRTSQHHESRPEAHACCAWGCGVWSATGWSPAACFSSSRYSSSASGAAAMILRLSQRVSASVQLSTKRRAFPAPGTDVMPASDSLTLAFTSSMNPRPAGARLHGCVDHFEAPCQAPSPPLAFLLASGRQGE